MIAKRIARSKGTSSAARLVRYMVAAQGGIDPTGWKRTADYILDTRGSTRQGEKVAGFRVTNCGTDDPAQAATIIELTQAANRRSRADKTYHLVFSFPQGERPPMEPLHAIEDELCAAIGLGEHQRISAVHIDTDHLHVHVAINKVHPTGLQNIDPFQDKQRLMEACERLEVQYGLAHDNHGLEGRIHGRAERITLGPEREHDSRFRKYLRESYAVAVGERPEAETRDGLRTLSGGGVAHDGGRYSGLLPGDARDRVESGRAAQPDGVRRSRDGAGGAADVAAGPGGKAADMEAHAGVESLTGYVAREVSPALRRASTWKELHAALAVHGLEIKPCGAGLVIGDAGPGLWCKASDCGRDLSLGALTERLGPFETAQGRSPTATRDGRQRYEARPRQAHPSSAGLWAEYQRQRQAARAERSQGHAALRAVRTQETDRIRRWAAVQRGIVKAGARGPVRKALQATIRVQVAAAYKAASVKAAAHRRSMAAAHPHPAWKDWLMGRAEAGDLEALAVLRARAAREERRRGDHVSAAGPGGTAFAATVEPPQARKSGSMVYRTADGGLVVDRISHVQAERATEGAALMALALAAQRFEGQALDVQGTDPFRRDVAEAAGRHQLAVRFSDPAMETMRQAAMPAPQTPQPGGPRPEPLHPEPDRSEAYDLMMRAIAGSAGDRAAARAAIVADAMGQPRPAVGRWIAGRNAARDTVSSIDHHRPWTSADAGAALYQGRRRMEDGSEVLLLKRGGAMLVKPCGPRVAAKASRWRVGQTVTTDARGRFLGNDGAEPARAPGRRGIRDKGIDL